jgi:hypothetical protein
VKCKLKLTAFIASLLLTSCGGASPELGPTASTRAIQTPKNAAHPDYVVQQNCTSGTDADGNCCPDGDISDGFSCEPLSDLNGAFAPGAVPLPTGSGEVAVLPKASPCYAAALINTPLSGEGHDGAISNVFVYMEQTPAVGGGYSLTLVAYEYQTYGGSEYWQFAGTISASASVGVSFASISAGASLNAPYVPFSSSIATDLSNTLSAIGYTGPDSPVGGLATIVSAGISSLKKYDCYTT